MPIIRNRELSARECLDYFRKRIERFNPALNAIVVFDWERAMRQALLADEALARGETVGPLHGVPMTVKEMFDLKGHPTTWGDPILRECIASEDDLVVQRLTASGAIVFGKSNVPLRLMDIQTYNDIYGTTNNPWDTTRAAGGSSGGSAAALAAGLTGLEFGSDIGGSIRNPAHYCGVYGHKPTYGLVGVTRTAPPGRLTKADLGVHGPLARSAEAWRAMQLLTAPADSHSLCADKAAFAAQEAEDVRVAYGQVTRVAVSENLARCQSIGDMLAKLGATVSDTARPHFDTNTHPMISKTTISDESQTELKHSEWARASTNAKNSLGMARVLQRLGHRDSACPPQPLLFP